FPHGLRHQPLQHPDPRPGLLLLRRSRDDRRRRRLPGAALPAGARSHRRGHLAQAPQELAYRHRRHDRSRRRAAGHRPGHDDARDGPPDRALPALPRPLGLLRAPLASGSRDRSSGRMTAVSADWVLPVDGPPIENGAVRFEDGRIVEVGEGRGERHYADAAILPGFVNAHSHLEYSRYAGFADGEAFGPWITAPMTRKNLLDYDEMLALARAGAFELLASGATTCADYSFSGAAGTAAGETGLRAVVYLEVFGADTAAVDRQFEEKRS